MITPVFPVVELIDRYAISIVKQQKTNNANATELEFYHSQVEKFDLSLVDLYLEKLIQTHNEIWELEKELKLGKESLLSLEEIGTRAIKIRDKNHQRIELKNIIAEKLGCTVKEFKQDHLSE